ncbi:NADH:flavin oxidoreductase [Blastopirellula marina]|uniref:NADH:flavin oxidoreductase n=1 Tax=Blastopirellula marina TaxID=124 RepID=A0A2S8G2B3_9BACT|nr:NADH:flavin oxidoreductase [Blastopirellula marina]PQO38585.1 NADH:flavin oxidoreductase [Blastopirellula marina]PTL45242.1 NADH:flavin oxidoreductase [Blastopirellula marina]
MSSRYIKVAQLKTVAAFRERLAELDLELPCDDSILTREQGSPLAEPLTAGGFTMGNRWCIHPMEGWDANPDGSPSEYTIRRWENFGRSGAKWIWGGEAAAVQEDGRANPNQTLGTEANRFGLEKLFDSLVNTHKAEISDPSDLMVGLQLTHSGRYCRPNQKHLAEPRIAYHHPVLDARVGIAPDDDSAIWTDEQLEQLIENFVRSATIAQQLGFHFVDVKCCHGYLLHEFLSARHRPGPYGGDFAGRTRLLMTIIRRIKQECPGLLIGVRLSIFDLIPFHAGLEAGEPIDYQALLPYQYGFGVDQENPERMDLSEPIQLLQQLEAEGVFAVNLSAGSPYYNPHIQRPAIFPPTDGYPPPEDPLVGVVRQIEAVRDCKQAVPRLAMIGTGYTYLQEYVPHVAQAVVRAGWVDSVGLGRMVLSLPELPQATLEEGAMPRKKICRTFSDCTSGPRKGLISGCYPLDPFYKILPEAQLLKEAKSASAK